MKWDLLNFHLKDDLWKQVYFHLFPKYFKLRLLFFYYNQTLQEKPKISTQEKI